jgi:diguanylate cyclase (GGDEF)-like protein
VAIFRRRSFLASAAIAALLVVAAGVYLADTQASARRKLHEDFAGRAVLAARLTSGGLLANTASSQTYARASFGGAENTVQAGVDADEKADPQARIIVTRGDGGVLGIYPHTLPRDSATILGQPEMRLALKGQVGISNVTVTATGPMVMVAIPFTAAGARRVWSSSVSLEQLTTFAKAYLATALGVDGGRAFLIDSFDTVIASTDNERPGARFADHELARALHRAASGSVAGHEYVSSAVPSMPWRIAFTAPTGALFAPLTSTRRVAWQLFIAFVLATFCVVGLSAFALKSSERLAHERLHDGLTGLPNRMFFMERTERALAAVRAQGGHLATLFIDLDRFKPINDRFGHAAGDALLTAVATRLNESVRSGDLVSRFGGDEFLVLCSKLAGQHQGMEIAERIQLALARPFEIDGVALSISCSIGIAFYSSNEEEIDAESLIGYADLAMYEAKRNGRARIETIEPTPVASPL